MFRRLIYYKFFYKRYSGKSKLISIGNIVSGGTGKTPITILIAKKLKKKFNVAICHRGYKGDFENKNLLISNQSKVFDYAKNAGDEPYLLALKLEGIPIAIGKNRVKSIKLLETEFPLLDFIILDDSFQHLKVRFDYSIAVFNSIGGIGNGFILPAGIMREPLFSLNFADKIIINGEKEIKELESFSSKTITGKYIIDKVYDKNSNCINLKDFANSNNILLSAIGLPKSFENTINKEKIKFIKHFTLADHAYYTNSFLKIVETHIIENNIDYVITTEKDFAKLSQLNHNLPLIIISVKFELENSYQLYQELISL